MRINIFWEHIQEREKIAAEIADDIFPVDFHIYAIKCPENCMMQIGVETVWQVIDGSFSGDKKKKMRRKRPVKKRDIREIYIVEDVMLNWRRER